LSQVAGVFTRTTFVSGIRLGIGAIVCALVVACGTSPKEASRPRAAASSSTTARADSASSSPGAESSKAAPSKPQARRKAKRQAKGKDQTRSAAAGKSGTSNAPKVVASPAPGAAAGTFLWPASGEVSARFNGGTNKGIDIRGNPGDPVVAAAKGRVVFVGSSLRGYGNLVMVKHDNDLMTAYAHNRKILVRENQQVHAGQQIAEMGSTDSNVTRLHFELRRGGHAVDPMPYLKAAPPAP
jgi:lipoprotein NlpD